MSTDRAPIRSYQRIFKPDRRIYQVEGHQLPVPGGVPLRWLAYATAALIAVLLLSSASLTLAAAAGTVAAVGGLVIGGRAGAAVAGAVVLAGLPVAGWLLGALDWPLRLVVLPALVATLATQATPDGRATHRFALSWLALRLRPGRRSLGRPLPAPAASRVLAGRLWVAPDERCGTLRRANVTGPAVVRAARGSTGDGWPRRRDVLRARGGEGSELVVVELGAGERLRVRP